MPRMYESPDVSSSQQVLQTVGWLKKLGFKAVALLPQSKAAVSRKYVEPGYMPPSEEYWQRGNYGVGVLTGPANTGPVDIDLDCNEALFFAPIFLPPTPAIFGRRSKPASHHLYLVNSATLDKVAFIDPLEKETIVEIRADGGHQTVMPGSVHQDTGELIEWSKVPFPEVPKEDSEALVKAVRNVAIATMVARHLWHEGQRNEVVKYLSGMFYYLDWPVEDAVKLIEAVMRYHGDDDKTRKKTVYNTYSKAEEGGKVIGATSLRKFLGDDRLVDRILEWAGSPTINVMQEYNERFCVVSLDGKFRIADTDVEPSKAPVFYRKEDFLNLMGTDTLTIDGKPVSKPRLWIANSRRRTARDVEFMPGVVDSGKTLNLWTGWNIEPKPGRCDGWLKLLEYLCHDDTETYLWMLQWFANIVRDPMHKSLTAPVIIGPQGAGKSLMVGYFGKVLGSGYTVVTNPQHIHGQFNNHLATTLLLHSEEALYGGDKYHRAIIKSLITDEHRIFEQKGIDARQVKNYLRLILTSNEAHAAPVESGDRRFTVLDMGERKAPESLIREVVDELHADGPQALFQHLLDIDYDRSVIRTNLKNRAHAQLKLLNMGPLQQWWFDTLSNAELLPEYLSWASKIHTDPWPNIVSSVALYQSVLIYLKDRNIRILPSESTFAAELNKMVGRQLAKKQMFFHNPQPERAPPGVALMGNRHQTIMDFPSLAECRAHFEKYVGAPLEWPEQIPEGERPPWEKY